MAVRTCIDRILPPEYEDLAMRRAIEDNPANEPGEVLPGLEAAVVTSKLWSAGRTLRVAFLDGQPEVQAKVERRAKEWEDHAGIRLDFVDGTDGEIRISFAQAGSWSALGTDALVDEYFPPDGPTMNYGWLTPSSSEEDYSVVLHEFGHALGMIHEHQNPATTIRWNREAVYRDLSGPPNNWSRGQIDHNVFNKYSVTQTQFTHFDPDSIMLYFFPSEWTLDGMSFNENTALSEMDMSFMGERYPLLAT